MVIFNSKVFVITREYNPQLTGLRDFSAILEALVFLLHQCDGHMPGVPCNGRKPQGVDSATIEGNIVMVKLREHSEFMCDMREDACLLGNWFI